MSVTAAIEKLKQAGAPNEAKFREQLERHRESAQRFVGRDVEPTGYGIDRSRQLAPIARPLIVRTVSQAG